jgi:hypothetical protein
MADHVAEQIEMKLKAATVPQPLEERMSSHPSNEVIRRAPIHGLEKD